MKSYFCNNPGHISRNCYKKNAQQSQNQSSLLVQASTSTENNESNKSCESESSQLFVVNHALTVDVNN